MAKKLSELGAQDRAKLSNFKSEALERQEVQRGKIALKLAEKRLDDAEWKLKARKLYGKLLMGLLIIQNFLVALLVYSQVTSNELASNANAIIGITAGTLGETAVIVHTVVKWLFSDTDYKP